MDFYHFQDLVTGDYKKIQFYLPFDDFKRPGTLATKDEHVTYREKALEFTERRSRQMAEWVMEHPPPSSRSASSAQATLHWSSRKF